MHVKEKLGYSERRICKVIEVHRSLMGYRPVNRDFQNRLRDRVVSVASEYGRYGYRQVTGMLNMEGWDVGKDRVFSIWQQEGLKVPQRQPKRARLWLADGSCIRKRPEFKNHVWSYDFVAEKTHDGRSFKILNILDEYSRECLLSLVQRRIRSQDVILALADLFLKKGLPRYIRSDNGPEFIATKLRLWRQHYNTKRPHSSLGYRPPAPEVFQQNFRQAVV